MAGAGWHDFVPGEVLTAANVQDYLQDQTVMKFASATARAAALPSPSQGMMSFLNDTGVVETYYAAWNATTNPGGKTAGAGWYATDRNDGLVNIVPPTVAVSGGSATANSLGVISFSAVSAISLNNVFTSTYNHYRVVIMTPTVTAQTGINIRMRLNGSDISTTSYVQTMTISRATGTIQANSGSNLASMALYIASNESNARFEWSGDIKNPALATQTVINGLGSGNDPTSAFGISGGGFVATTAAYDGFTIYPATGNITGTIQVYGYNQ